MLLFESAKMSLWQGKSEMPSAKMIMGAVLLSVAFSTWGCGGNKPTPKPTPWYTVTEHGFRMPVGHAQVEAAVQGESAFRVSIAHSPAVPQQHASPMVAYQSNFAKKTVQQEGTGVKLSTTFGAIFIDPNATFELRDEVGNLLVKSSLLSSFDGSFVKVSLGNVNKPSVFYGAGANAGTPLTMDKSTPTVSNHYGAGSVSWLPQYYSRNDRYAALAVASHDWSNNTAYWNDNKPNWANYPANWSSSSEGVTWTAEGSSLDVYLMPAADTYAYLKSLSDLTGKPRVPPRYAFGFFAGRWGWTDKAYIGNILKQFRDGNYPADAFITDFEFFTTFNDYSFGPEGNASYHDFGWNNVTFPDPAGQLKEYQDMGFQMGGIRKPRFGNPTYLEKLRKNGWLIPAGLYNVNGQGRNANFSSAGAKEWYQQENQHYLDQGVDFWWNDEGEVYYFQFHDWNQAQWNGFKMSDPSRRFFSLNRAFTPGMQNFGVAVWTGDISVSWQALSDQPKYLLNYNLAGNVYLGCDSGGFVGGNDTDELLTRWYWSSAFFTVMRVHSSKTGSEHGDPAAPIKPHFPFLYGTTAQKGMRKALEMRYRMIPLLYSLAHNAYETGAPITRPLLMEFEGDKTAVPITDQWLVGTGFMTAPVLTTGGTRYVWFPSDKSSTLWWNFNDTKNRLGGTGENVTMPLDATPLYVRSGTILPFGPVVQHTGALPGNGTLEVHVYAGDGQDISFTLVEDDGKSYEYETGATRKTTFKWTDSQSTIRWNSVGQASKFTPFTTLIFTLFSNNRREQSLRQAWNVGQYTFSKYGVGEVVV